MSGSSSSTVSTSDTMHDDDHTGSEAKKPQSSATLATLATDVSQKPSTVTATPLPASAPYTAGIPITKYRSLEGVSLAAPLARIVSAPQGASVFAPPPLEQYVNDYPGAGTQEDPYRVDFLPGERANPYNWSNLYRWAITFVIAMGTLCIAFASSAYTAAIPGIASKFQVSSEMGILGLTLYVIGFGAGPVVWAPISEMYGRTFAFLCSYPVFVAFNIAGATAQNIETILVSRLIAGTFGSSPITNAGGQLSDMWAAHERALATSFFALAPFLGPVFGPICGGFVAQNKGFRWVFWMQFFFGLVCLIVQAFFVPETYAPTLVRRKAKRLQAEADAAGTGEFFISKYDVSKKAPKEIVKTALFRPFQLLFSELIAFCLGLYGAIIYGTLYLFFEAFPIVFREERGWSMGIAGLAFAGIGVGLIIGNILTPFFTRRYLRKTREAELRGEKVAPEERLVPAAAGAIMLPIGLFWFAWTSQKEVHWIVCIIASVPYGTAFLLIFTGMQLYLIDAYTLYAASALAGSAVMRSVAGAVFPLFAASMYHRLGLNWAGTLVAFLSLACTPMPFLFYKYGPYLRRTSKYAPSGLPKRGQKAVPENEHKHPLPREEDALEPGFAADAGEHCRDNGTAPLSIAESMIRMPSRRSSIGARSVQSLRHQPERIEPSLDVESEKSAV